MHYLREFTTKHLPGYVVTEYDRECISAQDYYQYNWRANFIATCEFASVLKANILQIHSHTPQPFIKPSVSAEEIAGFTPGKMSINNLSLNLKHIRAWHLLSEGGTPWGLVMEDDIIFREGSIASILNLLEVIPDQIDYVDVAGGCGLHPNGSRFRHLLVPGLYQDLLASTRTTCCYIISRRFAQKLLELRLPLLFPIDFQLNYAFSLVTPFVAWCSPELVIHGSEHGYYPSSNVR